MIFTPLLASTHNRRYLLPVAGKKFSITLFPVDKPECEFLIETA